MPKFLVEYTSNNSGGDWWLSDDDWKLLEAKGWDVQWVKDDPQYKKWGSDGERWLGALAKNATKVVEAPDSDAAETVGQFEWELAVGMDGDEEGCHCCGQPHYFYVSELKEAA